MGAFVGSVPPYSASRGYIPLKSARRIGGMTPSEPPELKSELLGGSGLPFSINTSYSTFLQVGGLWGPLLVRYHPT